MYKKEKIMIKYRTLKWSSKIEPVEVERETDSSVWIKGQRNSKITEYHCYHDTWQEAKDTLLNRASDKITLAESMLSGAIDFLKEVEDLKQ
jgi:hypothetical protein